MADKSFGLRQLNLVGVGTPSIESSTDLVVNTNGSERVRITSSGNVGIGLTNPSELLTLRSTGEPKIQIEDADLTNRIGQISQAGGGMIFRSRADSSDGQFVFRGYGGGSDTDFVTIDSSGRLLVNTTSNFTRGNLQVVDGGGGELLIARNDTAIASGNDLAHIFFGANDGGTGYVVGNISVYADDAHSSTSHPSRIEFHTVASGSTGTTEKMRITENGTITSLTGVYNATTASAANVHVASNGTLRRSTSSAKYKTNIETLEDSYADALLDCRPVWYRSTCENDNPDHGWWGFIAEEVAAIDPRLVHWKTFEVTYDEKGSAVETPCDPEPEGVAYDRFVPHLLNLIKRQQQAIETLEAKVAALETP